MPVLNGVDMSWGDYNAAVGDAPRNPDGTVQSGIPIVSTTNADGSAATLNNKTMPVYAMTSDPSGNGGGGGMAPAPVDYTQMLNGSYLPTGNTIDFNNLAPMDPSLGAYAQATFGTIPGTPQGTLPTEQMRQLMLDAQRYQDAAKQTQEQIDNAYALGNAQLAAQLEQIRDNYSIQGQQLSQSADQFAQTFGLQQEQQAFQEQTFYANQAANPRNLIETALNQGNRTPGGTFPTLTSDTSGMVATPTSMNPAFTMPASGTSLAGAPGAPGTSGAPGATTDFSQQAVPVAGNVVSLLNRDAVPAYGTNGDQGFFTSLGNLQQNASLRLTPGALDYNSLKNVYNNPTDKGFLESTLSSQGQDPTDFFNSFNSALPQQQVNFAQGY